jgi:hypothetical protein
MLKKTLVALAVTGLVSTSVSAMTLDTNKNIAGDDFETNTLASQTKQDVLDKTTLDAVIDVTFAQTQTDDEDDELQDAGELILSLSGDAHFNPDKIAALLTATNQDTTGAATFSGGLGVAAAADPSETTTPASSLYSDISTIFKVDVSGAPSNATLAIRYSLDNDNQRLSIKLADTVPHADSVRVRLNFTNAVLGQAFKLTSGSSATVKMSIGALENASYTADPVSTPVLFKMDDLFSIKQAELTTTADATALVSDSYAQWSTTDVNNYGNLRRVDITNNTTNQNIQHKYLNLTLTGDFTGVQLNGTKIADDSGAATAWTVNTAKTEATATYSTISGDSNGLIPGSDGETDVQLEMPQLIIDSANTTALEAQSFTLSVAGVDNPTFDPYTQSIANAFVVTRDGLKFDTVTTGTTSSNIIYIRDTSKSLPADGGKIFVTITEFDAHGNDANANGTDLVTRKALSFNLPSNGAVTLTPAGVAADLGVEINPARQARFYFEVETNQGEAAVKKATSGGVDIQTGSKTDGIDFTL